MPATPPPQSALHPSAFPIGGGRMGTAIREFDWSTTPLGPVADWPQWLRTTVANLVECGQPIALWVGPDLTTIFNDGFRPILGQRADLALGRPLREVWFDVWDDIRPMVERALAGEPVWMEDLALTMMRNGYAEETFWTFSYSPVRDEHGVVRGLLDTVTETTQAVLARQEIAETNARLAREIKWQHEARRKQQVLQHELSHRMKNTLAMVQAVVSQSLRNATDPKVASELASARIEALARAQDALTASDWTATEVETIVRSSIAPLQEAADRFVLSGPAIRLDAQRSLGLALAIHELATNATKYGALSTPTGIVTICWNVLQDDRFRFTWTEAGGPAVSAPGRQGFGSRLTERAVPGYFAGRAGLVYDADGLKYWLEGTLHATRTEEGRD